MEALPTDVGWWRRRNLNPGFICEFCFRTAHLGRYGALSTFLVLNFGAEGDAFGVYRLYRCAFVGASLLWGAMVVFE